MSDMKTVENDGDVQAFLDKIENKTRREDAQTILKMMARVTGMGARMWGDAIVGFDRFEYKRSDGSQHSYMKIGFSPRKAALTVYIMPGFTGFEGLLGRLGKHKHSKSCLYITRLATIDVDVLEELVAAGYAEMNRRYG